MSEAVDIRIVSNEKEYADAMYVRRTVFVDEQNIKPSLEFDGNDFSATHFVAYVSEYPVGAMRIRYFKDFVKFERACVVQKMRKGNIATLLMQKASEFAAQKGFKYAHAVCKKELLDRWAKEGFFPVEGAETIVQNGMTLVPIEKCLPQTDQTITIQTSPDILNAKEGEWFKKDTTDEVKELKRKEQLDHFENMKQKLQTLKLEPTAKIKEWHPPLRADLFDVYLK